MSNDPSTYTIVRGRDRYAGAPDIDSYVNLDMEGEQREFLDADRSVLLNLEERFDTERQASNIFRVAGKITNLYDNSISGKSLNYTQFTNFLYYVDPTTSASMTTRAITFTGRQALPGIGRLGLGVVGLSLVT